MKYLLLIGQILRAATAPFALLIIAFAFFIGPKIATALFNEWADFVVNGAS